jgi:hypothetical protein
MAPGEELVFHDQVHDRLGRHQQLAYDEAVIRAEH